MARKLINGSSNRIVLDFKNTTLYTNNPVIMPGSFVILTESEFANVKSIPPQVSVLYFADGTVTNQTDVETTPGFGTGGGGPGTVASVFGRTGVIVSQNGDYTKSQVGLGNVDNVSDLNKPISVATQAALDLKSDVTVVALKANNSDLTNHVNNTSNPHSVTKAQVGLGNVDNTSDVLKPISNATQTALNTKLENASNLGGGIEIYAGRSGNDIQFKTLIAGSGISFQTDANNVQINAAGGGFAGLTGDVTAGPDGITTVNTVGNGLVTASTIADVAVAVVNASNTSILNNDLVKRTANGAIQANTIYNPFNVSIDLINGRITDQNGNDAINIKNRLLINSTGQEVFKYSDLGFGTNGQVLSTDGAGNLSWVTSSGGPGGGVNTDLSNLTTTSINESLIPNAPYNFDLGNESIPWGNVFTGSLTVGQISSDESQELTVTSEDRLTLRSVNDRIYHFAERHRFYIKQFEGNVTFNGGLLNDLTYFDDGASQGSYAVMITANVIRLGVQMPTGVSQVDDVLVGQTSGAQGTVHSGFDGSFIYLKDVVGTFQAGEIVSTGSFSGEAAVWSDHGDLFRVFDTNGNQQTNLMTEAGVTIYTIFNFGVQFANSTGHNIGSSWSIDINQIDQTAMYLRNGSYGLYNRQGNTVLDWHNLQEAGPNQVLGTDNNGDYVWKNDSGGGTFSWPLLAPDGSVLAPSFSFANDTDTGLYSSGSDNLSITVDGGQVASFTPGGVVLTGNTLVSGSLRTSDLQNNLTKFAISDDAGFLTALPQYGYNPSNNNMLVWNNEVVSEETENYREMHRFGMNLLGRADSREVINVYSDRIDVNSLIGGAQIGAPTDIKSEITILGIRYISRRDGFDGDVMTVEYVDGAIAGNEQVVRNNFDLVVTIESGVSTAGQIYAALNNPSINLGEFQIELIDANIVGVVTGPSNLTGGRYARGGINVYDAAINSQTTNLGQVIGYNTYVNLGDSNNLVAMRGYTGFRTNLNLTSDTEIDYFTGYEVNMNAANGATFNREIRGLNMFGGIDTANNQLIGVQQGFNIGVVDSINSFQTSHSVTSVLNNVNQFVDFGQFDTIESGYNGLAIQPNITGSVRYVNAVNIAPNIAMVDQSFVGLNVNMDNVVTYAGEQSEITIQGIHFVFNQPGNNNSYTLQFTPGATAGNEVVSINGQILEVQIEDGVSLLSQIVTAWSNNIQANFAITATLVGSDQPAVSNSATNFTNGVSPANRKAAYFGGDVQINGSLSFNGALSIGQLSAFAEFPLVNSPGGQPTSVHMLISSPTVPDNTTLANADHLGINTACLINIGENSTVTTSFIGVCALGLPAVVRVGNNSSIDRVNAAVFALSLDANTPNTGGTIGTLNLCSGLVIPNGVTTINELRAYNFELPAGNPAVETWGVHVTADTQNFMKGNLKIGGDVNTIGGRKTSDPSIKFEVEDGLVKMPSGTEAERDSYSAVNGCVYYNEDTNKFQGYSNGAWVDLH